jgi:hypothetical protein
LLAPAAVKVAELPTHKVAEGEPEIGLVGVVTTGIVITADALQLNAFEPVTV